MSKNYVALSVLFMFTLLVTAQTKDELEIRQQFWNSDEPQTKNVTIPEKWQNESAVILYRSEYYGYTNNGKKMYNPSSFHQRVKLQDKAAVEYFSEFEYEKDQKVGFAYLSELVNEAGDLA